MSNNTAHVQVYDGSRAGWRESDACNPVNAYGQTKYEAELLIQVLHLVGKNTSKAVSMSKHTSSILMNAVCV